MDFIQQCECLLKAYKSGQIGQTIMPEDTHPKFSSEDERLAYFTLPMSLNYQRNSYALWKSALATFEDKETHDVFDIKSVCELNTNQLREKLSKYKLALQPNKQTNTWHTLCRTLFSEFGGIKELFKKSENNFLKLQEIIQIRYKKDFPYLSGPKIFNYWSWIIQEYGKIKLTNSEFIEIAPDTHITKCSVLLGVINEDEVEKISKEEINARWRKALNDSKITPIEMHAPLWFWSKNNFSYKLE